MPEVFPIIPASQKAFWFLYGIAGLLLVLGVALVYVGWGANHASCEISPAGLRISGDLFGRTIPGHALIVDGARALDLAAEKDYQPRWRTLGTSVPGYQSGWFRLRNGEKALLFLTHPGRVVYVPTRDGYSLMLSVADPDAFLHALARNAS